LKTITRFLKAFLKQHPQSSFVCLSDRSVHRLYRHVLPKEIPWLLLKKGENDKTREKKVLLENQLLKKNYQKNTCIIGFGGGVVLDMAGALASTYYRGVSLLFIPTTLLAMVDASVGGKNALNTPFGKNLIGCFHLPHDTLIDPSFLQTLPPQELNYGLAEILKHGILHSDDFLKEIEHQYRRSPRQSPHWLLKNKSWITKVITANRCFKQQIVDEDPYDQKNRHILNAGHTFGHAIEELSLYRIPHGHAVAIGLWMESYLSTLCMGLSMNSFQDITTSLQILHLPLVLPTLQNIPLKKWLFYLKRDKKNRILVLFKNIGSPQLFRPSLAALVQTITWYNQQKVF
jgi:3-dehydroquinate synthase